MSQLCAYETLTFHRRSAKMFHSREKMNRNSLEKPRRVIRFVTNKNRIATIKVNPDSFPPLSVWTSCEQTEQQIFPPKALWRTTSNNQKVTPKCGRQRSKVKKRLLQRCALHKFHVTDGQNTRDQITSE